MICAHAGTQLRAGRLLFGALCALFLAPATAGAIDPARCREDGVTEVPGFASGRDGNQCLMIDPGNGDAPIPFQYEAFHRRGVGACDGGEGMPVKESGAGCENGQCLSLLLWDTVADNYTHPGCKNKDVLFIGNGYAWQYIYFKDTHWLNGWKCQGGPWKGPGNLSCAAGEDSSAHADNWQIRGHPVNGGWMVVQDSEIVNSHIQLMIHQTQSEYGPNGSVSFQGVRFETSNSPVGAAQHWIDDCIARGEDADNCRGNRGQIGYNAKEYWLIDVWGNSPFKNWPVDDLGKLIVVNTGCSKTGCNGTRGFNNGWPHPLIKSEQGPNTCPNGRMASPFTGVKEFYCYTSLEQAGRFHKLPPFANLSTAGWENPPASGGPKRPLPPQVLE